MQLSRLLPLALAGHAGADTLQAVLAANADQLSTLSDTVSQIQGAAQMLGTLQNVTLFAPSNDAFKEFTMQNPNFTQVASNTTAVTQLLMYHAVPVVMTSSSFNSTPMFMPTMLGAETMSSSSSMSPGMQVVGVQRMGESAMVISGFRQMSTVTKADIMFDGGVLHIVDRVLTVPQSPSVTALDTGMTSLYGALRKADMLASVDSLPTATIFVPNNQAFEAVGSTVENAATQDLASVLNYHVVEGVGMALFSPILMGMNGMMMDMGTGGMAGMNMKRHEETTMSLPTLQGGNITVRMDTDNGELFINSAQVVTSDIITSNGVIHVIDNVLNPMAANAAPDPSAATQAPAFTGATPAQDAPFTDGLTPATTITPATMTAAGPYAAMPTAALMAGGAAAMWVNL